MPKLLWNLVLIGLFTLPQVTNAACRTTFESILCQPDISKLPAPTLATPKPGLIELKRRPWLTPVRAFEISLAGGIAADSMSSWGCFESNPLLRSADGRFGAKGVAIKAGISGGGLLIAHLLHRRFPKLEKPLTFVFGGGSAWLHGVAIRNHAVGCQK